MKLLQTVFSGFKYSKSSFSYWNIGINKIYFGNAQCFNCEFHVQVFKTDLYVGQIMS